MRNRPTAALMALFALLLAGCTEPEAEAGAASPATASATPAASGGGYATGPAAGASHGPIRLASPPPDRPTMAPAETVGPADPEGTSAYIDDFLATQWSSGAAPSALSEASVGDCVYFDWEYSSGPTTSALFQVPCQEPHEGEIFGTITHAGKLYPGQLALERDAGPLCGEVISHFLEARLIPDGTHRLLFPTQADWDSGERTSVCLYHPGSLLERGYFGE